MTGDRAHWENAYSEKAPWEVSWYEPHPQRPLELIQATGLGRDAAVLDVGGGASGLAAQLLRLGWTSRSPTSRQRLWRLLDGRIIQTSFARKPQSVS